MRGLQAALTRAPFDGCNDERLGLMDTLSAYTSSGAWAAHRESVTGKLTPSMAGDLVILGGDIEAAVSETLGSLPVALTVCGGRITHEATAI